MKGDQLTHTRQETFVASVGAFRDFAKELALLMAASHYHSVRSSRKVEVAPRWLLAKHDLAVSMIRRND